MGICSTKTKKQIQPQNKKVILQQQQQQQHQLKPRPNSKENLRNLEITKSRTNDLTDSPLGELISPAGNLSTNPSQFSNRRKSMAFRFRDELADQVEYLRRNMVFITSQDLMTIDGNEDLILKRCIDYEKNTYIISSELISSQQNDMATSHNQFQIRYQGIENNQELQQIAQYIKYIQQLYDTSTISKLVVPQSIEHAVITDTNGVSFTHLFCITQIPQFNLNDISIIRQQCKRPLQEIEFLYILKEITQILDILQKEQTISHFNLKAENIYLTQDQIIKLGGFNFPPTIQDQKDKGKFKVKIQRWPTLLPPELFEFHNNGVLEIECEPFKFDICILALLILQLYDTNQFEEEVDTQQIMNNMQVEMPQLFNVLLNMLLQNPENRLSYNDILLQLKDIALKEPFLKKKEINEYIKKQKVFNQLKEEKSSRLSKVAYVNYHLFEKNLASKKMEELEQQIVLDGTNDDKTMEKIFFYAEIGSLLLMSRKPELACDILLKSLELLEPIKNNNLVKYIEIYKKLGKTYFLLKKYQLALETLLSCYSLENNNTSNLPKRKDYLTTLNNLGQIYMSLQDYDNALKYYIEASDLLEKLTTDSDPIRCTIWTNLGDVFIIFEQYNESQLLYEQSLQLDTKVYGEISRQVADDYKALGNLFKKCSDFKKALYYLKKSIETQKQCQGAINICLASTWDDLGELYNQQGISQKALLCYKKSLSIKQALLEKNNSSFATTLHNIAVSNSDLGNYKEATYYYEKCLEIDKINLGEKHQNIASTLTELGFAYSRNNQYDNAIKCYQNALIIDQEYFGQTHQTVCTGLHNIGLVYMDTKNYQEACDALTQSIKIKEQIYPENHQSISNTLYSLGKVHMYLQNYTQAEKLVQRALIIDKKYEDDISIILSMSYGLLGQIYYNMKSYEKSLEYLEKYLDIHKKLSLQYDEDYGNALNFIGDIYAQKNISDKAVEFYQNAIGIFVNINKNSDMIDSIDHKCKKIQFQLTKT